MQLLYLFSCAKSRGAGNPRSPSRPLRPRAIPVSSHGAQKQAPASSPPRQGAAPKKHFQSFFPFPKKGSGAPKECISETQKAFKHHSMLGVPWEKKIKTQKQSVLLGPETGNELGHCSTDCLLASFRVKL